ncbi:MAG: FtsW/RodA/SpoVE family cell cycle protein, partial [Gemmatimonadota bacterium]
MARAGVAALRGGVGPRRDGEAYPSVRANQDPSRLGRGWEGGAVLLITTLLASVGMVTVYSASAVMAQTRGLAPHYFLLRQMSGVLGGFVLFIMAAQLDYRRLRMLAWPVLAGAIILLATVILPGTEAIAPPTNGARRWLLLGPVGIQPAEVAKLALVLWTAHLAVKKQDRLRSLSKGLLPFLVIWGVVAGLILLQPDLSNAMLALLLAVLVAYAGGARPGHFIALGILLLPFLWRQVTGVAYRLERVRAFLDPAADVSD